MDGKPLGSGELVNSDRDNFYEKALPTLFPFGLGGIEANLTVNVDFAEHIR